MKNLYNLRSMGNDVYIAKHIVWKQMHESRVGSHIAVDDFFYCTTRITMGNYIHIGPHVSIIGGADAELIISHFVTISAGARIIVRSDSFDGSGLVSVPGLPSEYKNAILGDGIILDDFSAVGTNAVLMPHASLAPGVVVGANSLVTESIDEPWTIWVGSPARKLKDRPKEKILEYARMVGYDY